MSLGKLVSFQENVQSQQDVVSMFQSRVQSLKQNLLQTQECMESLKDQREHMKLRIDKQDNLLERREMLADEVSAVQAVYELTNQLSGWECCEMLSHSIRFERIHGDGMRHILLVTTKSVNGVNAVTSDIWMVNERAFDNKSVFSEILSAQDVACDEIVRRISSMKGLRDAMLALDVMFGRCRLLANELEHVFDSFTCENILYGRGNQVSFSICLTSTIPEPTKWTANITVGFGYPAGQMSVKLESNFGIPVSDFNLRSIGKGFNRLFRVCKSIQSLFYTTLN